MDINKYAFFAKTAELKNLSAAAEYLGYTQSAASHIISSLETGVCTFLTLTLWNGADSQWGGASSLCLSDSPE